MNNTKEKTLYESPTFSLPFAYFNYIISIHGHENKMYPKELTLQKFVS